MSERNPFFPPRLILERPDVSPAEVVFLKNAMTVGRIKSNDMVLAGDTEVSREHCRFEYDAQTGRTVVRDLNSANGTLLNGRPIDDSPHPLKDGDQIQIGRAVATYRETVVEEKVGATKPPLRHVRQKVFGAPLPAEAGEAERSIFGDDQAMCGRCGAVIDIRSIKPRGKVGCKRCRAVFKRP